MSAFHPSAGIGKAQHLSRKLPVCLASHLHKSGLSATDLIADIAERKHCRSAMHRKLSLGALASALLLIGCNSQKEPTSRKPQQFERKDSETVTTFATAPHQWRNDPDCFAKGTKIGSSDPFPLRAAAVKWRNPRRLHGYLYTNFEGWSFVAANRKERSEGLGEGRYQTEIYMTGNEISSAPEPRSYWIEFIGSEALCNSQSPDDTTFASSLSPNLMKIDKIEKQQRVR